MPMAECNLFNKSDGAVPPSCWLVRQLSEAPRVQNAWKPTELTDKRQGPENTTIYIIFTVGFPQKNTGLNNNSTNDYNTKAKPSTLLLQGTGLLRLAAKQCVACPPSSTIRWSDMSQWQVNLVPKDQSKMHVFKESRAETTNTHACIYTAHINTYHTYDVSMYHIECT